MPTAKIRGLRWWMMALLMMGSIINYLIRSSLSVAAPTLLQELHISAREYSWIVVAFQGAIELLDRGPDRLQGKARPRSASRRFESRDSRSTSGASAPYTFETD